MRFLLLLTVITAAGLSGCTANQVLGPEQIRPLHYSTGYAGGRSVEGLRAALEASPDQPVHVIAVHGMIESKLGFSREMQRALADRLGLRSISETDQVEPVEVYRGYRFTTFYGSQPFSDVRSPSPPSMLRRTAWVNADAPEGAPERLVFHELLWAPMRDHLKQRFIRCFEAAALRNSPDCPATLSRSNTDRRSLLNGALKDEFMVNGFADATLVLSPAGDVIRDDVMLALCALAVDILRPLPGMIPPAAGERCDLAAVAPTPELRQQAAEALRNAKVFAITHSLGSFLIMDAQLRFAEARVEPDVVVASGNSTVEFRTGDEAVQEFLLFSLFDDATIFMNANQVSLLSLARLSTELCEPDSGSGPCPNRLLRRPDPMDRPAPLDQMSTYVAFNDTDDLLGFELPTFLPEIGGNRYINVSVRNPGWSIPGLLRDPLAAHTAQEHNPAIVHAIAEGFEVPVE